MELYFNSKNIYDIFGFDDTGKKYFCLNVRETVFYLTVLIYYFILFYYLDKSNPQCPFYLKIVPFLIYLKNIHLFIELSVFLALDRRIGWMWLTSELLEVKSNYTIKTYIFHSDNCSHCMMFYNHIFNSLFYVSLYRHRQRFQVV